MCCFALKPVNNGTISESNDEQKGQNMRQTSIFIISALFGITAATAQEWAVEAEPAPPTGAQQGQQADPWGAQPATEPDPMAEMQQIQMQLQQISAQLSQVQQQAFQLQEVMDAFAAYEQQLRAKMVDLSPDAADDIETAEELVEELRAVQDPNLLSPEEAEEFQEKYMVFQQTVQRLQPLEQQASQDPEIQAAQQELEVIVTQAMDDVSPEASDMMDQRDQLIQRYLELEQQQQRQAPAEQPMLDFPDM